MILDILLVITISAILLSFLSILVWYGIKIDMELWNHGKCRECGHQLKIKYVDDIGNKYYECTHCCKMIRIKYDIEK